MPLNLSKGIPPLEVLFFKQPVQGFLENVNSGLQIYPLNLIDKGIPPAHGFNSHDELIKPLTAVGVKFSPERSEDHPFIFGKAQGGNPVFTDKSLLV
jgi:hypothetical protein